MRFDGDRLALYHYDGCPFCTTVRREIDRLGVDVELRDVFEPEHRTALRGARGRTTVPVLRIESGDEDHWMPESRDIVRWLRERFADRADAGARGG